MTLRKLSLVILALALPLIGCSDQRIIEKLGFIRTTAYELAGDGEENQGKIKVTVSIPKTTQKEAVQYSAVAKTAREARIVFDRQNDRRLVNGQMRQALFGASLAREGVWTHIDSLMRDPSVGNRVHFLVVEGSAEELLKRKYPQGGTAGEYIDNLIRVETGAMNMPDTTLYSFARDYYDDGIDPIAAIIRGQPESIIFDGIALFERDRMTGKVEPDDLPYFGILYGKVKSGDLFVDFTGDDYSSDVASMLYFSSRRKIKVRSLPSLSRGTGPKVTVKVSLSGSLLEYVGTVEVSKRAEQAKLEKEIAKFVKLRCERLIRRMQDARADAIGIGQYVRNSMRYSDWEKLDWAETFSKAEIDVEVGVRIRNFGKRQ
ncbi:Ger(x)C family spore germination protein [Cohnella thailandensis]|uniref:Ger(X)C family spore germination protein n=1 Tax=Cohnella thailandensis TaxID=557557 RepID=A0A841SZ29_9BACL|nr:Ger(x)C family spore germination protein [Cohnella thailandensis]MBB6635886.1 Ger(x)C family spore germination protein [Cohnella thailandensis]MBP1976264.1 spore germination protein [Cohnella thailandensis]